MQCSNDNFNPRLFGNPQIRPPGLRNPPSTVHTGFPLAIPERMITRQSLYDLARDGGLFRTPQVSLPDSPPLICVLTTRHTPHLGKANLRRSCAPSDYISSRQLCTQQRGRTSIWIYTQSTPNSARSHYDINSGIHIYLTTINNASLSHNSKYVRLLQERTLNKPDFPRHHRRPPPVKAAISHGDSRDSLSYSELPSTNCFVHNI